MESKLLKEEGLNIKIYKQFEYVIWSTEDGFIKQKEEECILFYKGIKEHVCDLLEGGEESFKKCQNKYNIKEGTGKMDHEVHIKQVVPSQNLSMAILHICSFSEYFHTAPQQFLT